MNELQRISLIVAVGGALLAIQEVYGELAGALVLVVLGVIGIVAFRYTDVADKRP